MADATSQQLLTLAETDVNTPISPAQYGGVLTSAPFVLVDGTFNTRDLGLVPGSPIRSNAFFRSGMLAQLSPRGKATLSSTLKIKRIFDLRSPEERASAPDPELEGIEATWLPTARPEARPDLSRFAAGEGEEGYEGMYLEVIELYEDSWRAILEHLRDRPGDGFLVHCTAGRDRTGVLAALLLALAGASEDVIALDWLLTRIGTEPVREMLLAYAKQGSDGNAAADPVAFHNLISLKRKSWDAFLRGLERKYGGFEGFVTGRLGFSETDVDTIKANLKGT